ncbi:MAG: RluA family pseudouridine synthase [Saprospirales bacterium]|nr:MAG: RluA family pseudouridine synthase [Saprospirales bacterium]
MNVLQKSALLYEDKNILVLNKIPAVPSVEDQSGDPSMQKLAEDFFNQKLFPVNRLDRPSSGVQVLAKNSSAAAFYSSLLKDKKITKKYIAITEKKPDELEGAIDGWIAVDKKRGKSFFSLQKLENGKSASSHYQLLSSSDNYFLLGIELITGRQHQIRAQLSFLNCPIKGDVKYGARRKNKDRSICLHALWSEFPVLGGDETIKIFAPLPQDPLWQFFHSAAVDFFNTKKN